MAMPAGPADGSELLSLPAQSPAHAVGCEKRVCPTGNPATHVAGTGTWHHTWDADMQMTTSNAATRVTSDLVEAEDALNEALLKQSSLLCTMLIARQEFSEPFIGQDAMMRLVKSQQSLLTAGGDLARVHHILLKIGRERGAVIHDCPENRPMRPAKQELPVDVSPGPDSWNTALQNVVAFG